MTCTVGISNLNSSKLFNKNHLFLQIIFFLSLPPSSWSSFVFPPPTTHLQLQMKHQNKVPKNLFASTWHSYLLRGPNGDFWGFIKHSWWSKSKEPATRWKEELRRKKKKKQTFALSVLYIRCLSDLGRTEWYLSCEKWGSLTPCMDSQEADRDRWHMIHDHKVLKVFKVIHL